MQMIRDAQMKVFALHRQQACERALADMARDHWPDVCRELGDQGTLQAVRRAVLRARSHGLTSLAAMAGYLNLCFLLGDSFDADPDLPWVAHFLNDTTMRPEARVRRLCDYAVRRLSSSKNAVHA